jgi:protein-tyrosine phosphatase
MFSEFKEIDKYEINHPISNFTTKSYANNNLIVSTRLNINNNEEITFVLYNEDIKSKKFMDSLSEPINHIVDNIFIGNLLAAIDDSILDKYEIKSIVQVFDGFKPTHNKYNYLLIEIDDNLNTDIQMYFNNFINFINKYKNENILIHCQHGSSRSGSFVIFYLMYFKKMTFDEAFTFAKNKRFCINPNDYFKNQLINYSFNVLK